jgi:hypothetical protein
MRLEMTFLMMRRFESLKYVLYETLKLRTRAHMYMYMCIYIYIYIYIYVLACTPRACTDSYQALRASSLRPGREHNG